MGFGKDECVPVLFAPPQPNPTQRGMIMCVLCLPCGIGLKLNQRIFLLGAIEWGQVQSVSVLALLQREQTEVVVRVAATSTCVDDDISVIADFTFWDFSG